MNWMQLRSAAPRRPRRLALLGVAAAAAMLLGACSSPPATPVGNVGGGNGAGGSATVRLNPASGPVSLTPTWSTTTACATGYQGSAVFRIIQPNGSTFSISSATNTVTTPFSGTLLDPIGLIQSVAGVPNGGSAELVVICFSGDSLTGNPNREMDIFITFSGDGRMYTTSATAPA